MKARVVTRTIIEAGLTLARWPLAGMVSLLPRDDAGSRESGRFALDRLDAAVRGAVGTVMADPVMREDARRRRTAAQMRAEAQDLAAAAKRTSDRADAELRERKRESAAQRQQARREANTERAQARRQRDRETEQAAQAESSRLDSSHKAAEQTEEALAEAAPRARLEALHAKDEALREKEKAISARDEASRLRAAAGRAKKARRNDGSDA